MHPSAGGLTPRRAAWLGAAALSFAGHLWWLDTPAASLSAVAASPPASAARPAQPVLLRSAASLEAQPLQRPEPTHDDAIAAKEAPEATPARAPDNPAARQGDHDDNPFLPRSALSVVPRAQTPVLLTTPPNVPDGRYSAELTLFIDEAGQVRRVRIDTAGLLPALEAQARQAFMTTRFQPGEVDGQRVRARLRVAVEFEAQGPARATGVPAP